MLQLDEEQVVQKLGESESAIFTVDRQVVDRWFAQEGGGWRGKRALPCELQNTKPNLRPKLLTISSDGKPVDEVDLLEMGTGEPLLICDRKTGNLVDLASRLDQGRDYALICGTDLGIPGAVADFKLKDRCVYRLVSPWRSDLAKHI